MLWHQQPLLAQSILLNFQEFIDESIQHTHPDENYFFEKNGNDIYFSSQVLFPLMSGIVSDVYEPNAIDEKCKLVKQRFKNANYPITWFWPHDMDLPENIQKIFSEHGFSSMGKYTSVALEKSKLNKLPTNLNKAVTIRLVETDEQFKKFLNITQIVYGIKDEALVGLARLYSAYKASKNIRLYLAEIDKKPVATVLSYKNKNTLGLYNGATLEAYRKQGLLGGLIQHAIKDSHVDYVVAQLMAAQNAKGILDKLGFQVYSHFYPLCSGFNLDEIHA